MKITVEYNGRTFNANLSDTERNMRLVLNMAWGLVGRDDVNLIFMPDFSKKLDEMPEKTRKQWLKMKIKKPVSNDK